MILDRSCQLTISLNCHKWYPPGGVGCGGRGLVGSRAKVLGGNENCRDRGIQSREGGVQPIEGTTLTSASPRAPCCGPEARWSSPASGVRLRSGLLEPRTLGQHRPQLLAAAGQFSRPSSLSRLFNLLFDAGPRQTSTMTLSIFISSKRGVTCRAVVGG